MSNTNPNTGIRYGTIYLNHLNSDVASALFDDADNVSLRVAQQETKAEIDAKWNQKFEDGECSLEDAEDEADREYERACEELCIEEPYLEGECEGVKYGISWLGGAPLLWIFESPYTIKADLCSPCLPGAGNLNSLNADGYECYDIPKDWRDESH